VLTETSIGRLFVGGFLPGILMGLSMMVLVYFNARNPKHGFPPPRRRLNAAEMLAAIKAGFLAFLAPVILLLAFFTGVVTPTEAGVIAVLYSLLVGFVYGELNVCNLYDALKDGAEASGVVMFIIATAQVFAWIVAPNRWRCRPSSSSRRSPISRGRSWHWSMSSCCSWAASSRGSPSF